MDRPVCHRIELNIPEDTILTLAVVQLEVYDMRFGRVDERFQALFLNGHRNIIFTAEIKYSRDSPFSSYGAGTLAKFGSDFCFQRYFTHTVSSSYPLSTSNNELMD